MSAGLPRDPALEQRILAAIAAAPDGLDITELAEKVVDFAATVITPQMWSRVQLSCWDLANEGTIKHATPGQRYVLVRRGAP